MFSCSKTMSHNMLIEYGRPSNPLDLTPQPQVSSHEVPVRRPLGCYEATDPLLRDDSNSSWSDPQVITIQNRWQNPMWLNHAEKQVKPNGKSHWKCLWQIEGHGGLTICPHWGENCETTVICHLTTE